MALSVEQMMTMMSLAAAATRTQISLKLALEIAVAYSTIRIKPLIMAQSNTKQESNC